jgi:hypothetical protein
MSVSSIFEHGHSLSALMLSLFLSIGSLKLEPLSLKVGLELHQIHLAFFSASMRAILVRSKASFCFNISTVEST